MSNNVIVIGNGDIPEDIRTELPDGYNVTKISDQDDLKNKTNSGTDASYAVITADLSIFFGIKENSVNEELVICFRALMDLENAIVFAKRNTNNDIKRTYKKAGFYHVTNTNWADLTYGKFRLQYKENETIDRNDTDWYDFSGRYNLYKLRNLLKEEDNNKDEVKKKIESVISKIDKEKEKMASYWGVFGGESIISKQMDDIQNKIKDLLENIKKAEQTNIRNKDNLAKNNEDVKKLIDNLTGNLNKQKHSGLIELLENAENQIGTLVTKAKNRSDQVLIQQLQTVINDLEGKNNSPFLMPERVGTLTVQNPNQFTSSKLHKLSGGIPGYCMTATLNVIQANTKPWGKEYFVGTTGKNYFKYTFPKTSAPEVELPFIPGIKKGETFTFYASEPRGSNITHKIFFEEDIIKAEITKKNEDTLGIRLIGEINEKYNKNQNMDFTVLLEYISFGDDPAIEFKIKGKHLKKTMEQKLERSAVDDIILGEYFLIPVYDSNESSVNAAFVSGFGTNISDYINLDRVCEDADVCIFPCTNDVLRGQCLSDDFTGREIDDFKIYYFLEQNVKEWNKLGKIQQKSLTNKMKEIILNHLGYKGKTRKEVRGMMNKPWLTFGNVFSSAWKLLALTSCQYAMNVNQTYNHFNEEARMVPWEHRCNLDVTQVENYFNQTKNSIEDYGYDDIENKAIEQVYSLLNPHAQSCRNRTIPGRILFSQVKNSLILVTVALVISMIRQVLWRI